MRARARDPSVRPSAAWASRFSPSRRPSLRPLLKPVALPPSLPAERQLARPPLLSLSSFFLSGRYPEIARVFFDDLGFGNIALESGGR